MRRRILLTLAWLPCLLGAIGWVGSYRIAADAAVGGYGADVERGGAYLLGPELNDPRTFLTTFPAIDFGREVGGGSGPINRWYPVRVLLLTLSGRTYRVVVVSLWVPTLALAFPPLWLVHRYRRRRRAPGHCAS